MHTIELELDDSLYDDIVKKGIDIQSELKEAVKKILYAKEYKIASEINQSMQDLKDNKSRPISELLSEIWDTSSFWQTG